MGEMSFDTQQYKSDQKSGWTAVGEGWRKWMDLTAPWYEPLIKRLMALADIKPGHKVLDVATGVGEPALTIATFVGPTGNVCGIDQAPGMLENARIRAYDRGLTNVIFKEMDAENLEVSAHAYDAAVCRWGLMFMPDLPRALQGIQTALKPGGRFATAVWGLPPHVPMLSVPMMAIREVIDLPPPPEGMPGPFNLAAPGLLESHLRQVGFVDVQVETFEVVTVTDSVDQSLEMTRDLSAPLVKLLAQYPEELQSKAWLAITAALQARTDEQGRVVMSNQTILASGMAPRD